MLTNIYFFTSFGRLDMLPVGGGQTASRRLWHTLEKLGYNVEIFNRHRYYWYKGFLGRFLIALWIFLDPIWLFIKLLSRKRKDSALLFMTYSGSLLLFDFMISFAGYLAGHKMIMYLAGGKAQWSYNKGGALYKMFFRRTICLYDEIMCEGEKYIKFIDKVSDGRVKTYYLPNFTEDGFAPTVLPQKPKDKINILYFGRIAPTKEVIVGIETFNLLAAKYENVYYTIVGGGDEDYESKVMAAIEVSPYRNRITKYPRSNHEFLANLMKDQHIYLFPSHEPCEGHSNALNEAMSWGVVPVVSNNNFLPSIVGDERLVVDGYEPCKYCDAISRLIASDELCRLSKMMYDRVKECFTESQIQIKLGKELANFNK